MSFVAVALPAHSKLIISGLDRCDQLEYDVCTRAPGRVEKDSTGEVMTTRGIRGEKDRQALNQLRERAGEYTPNILANWRGRGIYERNLTAMGMQTNPACSGTNNFNSPSCTKVVSEIVGTVAGVGSAWGMNAIQPEIYPELQNVPLEGLDLIRNDQRVKVVADMLSDRYAREQIDPARAAKTVQHFEKVRASFIEMLRQKFADSPNLEGMISQIEKVKFKTDCRDENDRSAWTFIQKNGFYDSAKNTISLCQGHLRDDSLFPITRVLAHELGHAIDPCSNPLAPRTLNEKLFGRPKDTSSQAAAESEQPTASLIRCLREPESIGAKRLSPFKPLGSGLCANDQINESVADWMSAEVMGQMAKNGDLGSKTPDAIAKGVANAFAGSCDSTSKDQHHIPHPIAAARINKIFALQPDLRTLMGCGPTRQTDRYCPAKGAVPQGGSQPAQTQPEGVQ